jgi:hypothetical protein
MPCRRSIADAARQLWVTQQTRYRGRRQHGGMTGDQPKRLQELGKKNQRPRKAVSDPALDTMIPKEAARISRRVGLKIPQKRKKRGRLRLAGGC